MACAFYYIAYKYDNFDEVGWVATLAKQTNQPFNTSKSIPDLPTLPSLYVSSLYYCLTSLTTIGFGNMSPNTTAEKIFGSIFMIVGGMFRLLCCVVLLCCVTLRCVALLCCVVLCCVVLCCVVLCCVVLCCVALRCCVVLCCVVLCCVVLCCVVNFFFLGKIPLTFYLFSALGYAVIFGQVTAIVQQAQKQSEKYHSLLDNIKSFQKLYRVPDKLSARILDYFMSTWALTKGVDTDEVSI